MTKGDAFCIDYTITPKIYQGFIDLFGDNNPLHTDVRFAQQHGFPSEVMHGNMLGGFLSHFVGECLPVKNVIIHSQALHFLHPCHLHDTLKFRAVVQDVFESVQVVEFDFSFCNGKGTKVAKGKVNVGMLA